MAKVQCYATCYMPSDKSGVKWERYEDWEQGSDGDIYTIPGHRVAEFLATGRFTRVHSEEDENDD